MNENIRKHGEKLNITVSVRGNANGPRLNRTCHSMTRIKITCLYIYQPF